MFSSSSLVKLIVFEKQKNLKTNKNCTNTEKLRNVASICGAIIRLGCKKLGFWKSDRPSDSFCTIVDDYFLECII